MHLTPALTNTRYTLCFCNIFEHLDESTCPLNLSTQLAVEVSLRFQIRAAAFTDLT
jgi:hypothetical protein